MNIHLTFDIDWAPDWVIEDLLEILDSKDVKATIFCTHKTEMNQEICHRGHNLGIHPNFMQGSTQGESVKEIINNLLDLVPNAKCIRNHGLYQSTRLLYDIFSLANSLTY